MGGLALALPRVRKRRRKWRRPPTFALVMFAGMSFLLAVDVIDLLHGVTLKHLFYAAGDVSYMQYWWPLLRWRMPNPVFVVTALACSAAGWFSGLL